MGASATAFAVFFSTFFITLNLLNRSTMVTMAWRWFAKLNHDLLSLILALRQLSNLSVTHAIERWAGQYMMSKGMPNSRSALIR